MYCALVDRGFMLCIRFLYESCGQIEWMSRMKIDLGPLLTNFPLRRAHGPWRHGEYNMSNQASKKMEFEWDSDDDSVSGTQEGPKGIYSHFGVDKLGFHPNKDIIFLLELTSYRVLAYHLTTSKLKVLGQLSVMSKVFSSFPFTPCRMGDL